MTRLPFILLTSLFLAGCAGKTIQTPPAPPEGLDPVAVKLIAFNDFHGNIEPPRRAIDAPVAGDDGKTVRVPAGGAAYLAAAINRLRAANPNALVVSAGDMIGASPLVSAVFLDEPTIEAMNLMKVDYNAVGNHEFDKGRAELLRMQNGGCGVNTVRQPCQLSPEFAGASFGFLAANTLTEDGSTLLPGYAIRSFGEGAGLVRVGIIGMTLEATPTVVTPAGVAGLSFRDEADTVNALIPKLRHEGADAIVVLVHEGATTKARYNAKSCDGLGGDLPPILDRLDPAVDLVISGHTHQAYICDYSRVNPAKPFWVTSGGQYGTLLTDITLTIDPVTRKVIARAADNIIVQSAAFTDDRGPASVSTDHNVLAPDAAVDALVARYVEAARPLAARVVGRMAGTASREHSPSGETAAGNLVADAQWAATRSADKGGAEIAFMNAGGVRADLVVQPDGTVTYGALFSVQPFGNGVVVKSFTGAQLRTLLEQQFLDVAQPRLLSPSQGFAFTYDLTKPYGSRIVAATYQGKPLDPPRTYRVAMNNFLASGGDKFTVFAQGTDMFGGPNLEDLVALESYIAANPGLAPPARDRITKVGE